MFSSSGRIDLVPDNLYIHVPSVFSFPFCALALFADQHRDTIRFTKRQVRQNEQQVYATTRVEIDKPNVPSSPFVPRYNRFSPIVNIGTYIPGRRPGLAPPPTDPVSATGPDFATENSAGITMLKTMLTAWPRLQDSCRRILDTPYETALRWLFRGGCEMQSIVC